MQRGALPTPCATPRRNITLRLHVPTTPLVPPPSDTTNSPLRLGSAGPADSLGAEGDRTIGPLRPKSGAWVPVLV